MTTQTIDTAARQYATRPQDEQFPSLAALVANAEYDKAHSAERAYNLKDLRAVPVQETPGFTGPRPMTAGSVDTIALQSPRGVAQFTHYSFGQLCRTIGAPAGYLRELPPTIATDAINFGLQDSAHGATANLLIRANGGQPVVRAVTTETYGRVWDANLYGELAKRLCDRDPSWQLPPTWSGEAAGAYRGDRDSFLIVVNGGSIVTDPSLRNGATPSTRPEGTAGAGPVDGMYRGIMVRNSEVGHCSVTIEEILFRYICGNHMLWGAIVDRSFKRRHVGKRAERDTLRYVLDLAWRVGHRSASADEAIIRGLIEREIAHTKEAVVDELRKMGATKDQATAAYENCERNEAVSPRSFWGIAQGMTRESQQSGWQDDRLALDLLAAQVMRRGALLAA